MFNFNDQRFNFNQVLESKRTTYSLSLDDFDDEDFNDSASITPSQSQTHNYSDIIDTELDFRIFLKVNVFNPLNISIDSNSEDFLNGANRYAWKKYSNNGETHFLAYINIIQERNSKKYEHDLYVDLNDTTKELHIGNCTTYQTSKFLTISYPLIKICEHYKDGPVYIGCIKFDKPYSAKATANNILNGIETPLKYIGISENISFWRTIWNGKGYYLPDVRPGNFIEIEKDLKLTSDFVNHFSGIDNKLRHGTKVPLFYNMFESFEDFNKVTKIFCDANALVFTEFGFEFTKENYNEDIIAFENRLNEKLGKEILKKQKLASDEDAAEDYFSNLLPQSVLDHFDSINSKSPMLLSIKTLAKERKSKDPYRKLDLPIVKLILKDNGIDVDKIVNDYEEQWLISFYKFVNLFYTHCQKLNINDEKNQYNKYVDYEFVIDNLFIYDRFNIRYIDKNGDKQDFDGFTDDELILIKDMVFGLKPELIWDDRELRIDKSKLSDPNDELLIYVCRKLLCALGHYSGSLMASSIDENNHTYNEFLILQRFIYLLYNQYVDDYNANIDDNEHKLEKAPIETLYNMKYTYVNFGYYGAGDYYPFNFGDIGMKLNTYAQLYKFLTYVAYIIENGYDIHCPNLGFENDSRERLLRVNGLSEDLNDVIKNEFNLNNKLNLKLLNTDSIFKMFSTIFTNIDKKL